MTARQSFVEDPARAAADALATLSAALGDRQATVDELRVPRRPFPSAFDVTAMATATVAAATSAVASWLELHEGRRRAVVIDGLHVAAAFASERHLTPRGWTLPSPWDPFAGDYPAADGFVRLHTNYSYHRDAALRALGVSPDRDVLARAVALRSRVEVEGAVVAAGGCAAAMHDAVAWDTHPAGRAVGSEPLVACWTRAEVAPGSFAGAISAARPLASVRVLDLTRVIAGPVATRFLAAYGAQVLRLDPPGFVEVPALLPETTAGKRCASLDLKSEEGRGRFDALLAEADVLVHGLRRGALRALGYSPDHLQTRFPRLVVAGVNAYGVSGPWALRRGFDSLVQMSTGIAARGMNVSGAATPVPLPVQALDHGTGYLLASAIIQALRRRAELGWVDEIHVSLARTAAWLTSLGVANSIVGTPLQNDEVRPHLEEANSAWGPLERVRCPGTLEGVPTRWTLEPGPLGRSGATWE
ncbi:MAG: CoA transferase [Polyangia bacterium]